MSSYRRSFFKKLGMLVGGYWGGSSSASAGTGSRESAIPSGPQTDSEEPIRGQYDLIVAAPTWPSPPRVCSRPAASWDRRWE